MRSVISQRPYARAAVRGVVAGTLAGVVQVAVGAALDRFLLPPRHDNNIAPRFIRRLQQRRHKQSNPATEWLLGTLFHFAYGIGWGAAFGLARYWTGLPSLVLGTAMGGLIYLLAFSRQGAGTQTGTELKPEHRPWQKQVSLVAVAWTFALSTAVLFDRLKQLGGDPEP